VKKIMIMSVAAGVTAAMVVRMVMMMGYMVVQKSLELMERTVLCSLLYFLRR
jgi:hypothetical protein